MSVSGSAGGGGGGVLPPDARYRQQAFIPSDGGWGGGDVFYDCWGNWGLG